MYIMEALQEYQALIKDVDRRCDRIRQKYADHIACVKGCPGNCCRIHISAYPVAAAFISRALQKLPGEMIRHIRQKARQTGSFGPCPLLEDGACLMYNARTIICRTHGLPILSEYRGHRSIGFCQKNFQNLPDIHEADAIDLGYLNSSLAGVNHRFMREFAHRLPTGERFTIGEALLMEVKGLP